MELKGTIKEILPLQSGVSKAGREWKKQGYVLETDEEHPHTVMFSFFGDKADENKLSVGELYNVSIEVESREYNGRWYTEVNAYKAEQMSFDVPQQAPIQTPQPEVKPEPKPEPTDNLPF